MSGLILEVAYLVNWTCQILYLCSFYNVFINDHFRIEFVIRQTEVDFHLPGLIITQRYIQNVNVKGTIYSMWIILRNCQGGCLVR